MAFKYETVAASLRDLTAGLPPHHAIPSERELQDRFGVSRLTVRHAIAKLVDEGVLYNVHGSGTYVGSNEIFSKAPKLTSFSEDMRSRGYEASSQLLGLTRQRADAEVALALGISEGAECIHIRRLRLADARPLAVEDVHVPGSVLQIEQFSPTGSLYEQLAQGGHEIFRAEQEIKAINLEQEYAALLDVAAGAAALEVSRVSSDRRGRRIEHARTIYRADRYSFQLAVTREADK